MAYTYDPIFAADPSNAANVAASASITIFDPNDPSKAPVTITDVTGSPLPNPITVNAKGFGPAFQHATLDRVGWFGAGFTNYFTAYEGMKDEAVAARAAAESAADQAAAAAADRVTAAAVNPSGKLILTKGNGGTVDAGSVIGPTGPKGDKGADGANVLPTDDAIEAQIKTKGSKTEAALSATYAGLVQLAKNPDTLIAGAVTLDASDQVVSAAVKWPDGTPGTMTITSRDATGAVNAYNITYGSPATKTFTQPAITRNANGAATNVPQIVVS